MTTHTVLRVGFCALMFAAAFGKLFDMAGFAGVVASYRLAPDALVLAGAWALALAELGMGLWLAAALAPRLAAQAVIAFHIFYLLGLASALLRGLELPNCGCFGMFWARPLSLQSLVIDLLLLALAVWLWKTAPRATERSA